MKRLSIVMMVVGVIVLGITTFVFAQSVSVDVYPLYVAKDGGTGTTGTPFAIFVNISGWSAGAGTNAYIAVRESTTGSHYFRWTADNTWSRGSTYSSANYPILQIDANGDAKGWIFLKYPSDKDFTALFVRARSTNGSTLDLSSAKIITPMDMSSSGTGAWVEDSGNPPQGYVVLAYSNSDILGAYAAENNNVTEGYDPTSGYWKIAVPAGASITKLEARDSNNDIYATDTVPGWTAGGAGTTTTLQDVSLPVTLSFFAAIPTDPWVTLKWRTESEVDNLGWDIYRSEEKDGKFIKINKELIPGAGNSAMPNTYQFVDKTAIKGRQYYYYLEDVDIAGTRNKSSIIPISKEAKKLTTTWSKIKKG